MRWVILISVVLVLVAIGLLAIPNSLFEGSAWLHLLSEIRKGLAEALIIAAVLACTVDFFVKKRLVDEVTKNVAPYILAHNSPSSLREEILNICASPTYRLDHSANIKIEPHRKGFVSVTQTHRFKIANSAKTPMPYRFRVAVTQPFKPTGPITQIQFVEGSKCLLPDGRPGDFSNPVVQKLLEMSSPRLM